MRHAKDASPRSSRRRGLLASAVVVAIGLTGLVALATSASATPAPKYFVCKYVATPGEGEVLQTGDNPISVSGNAIPMSPVVVGAYFGDSHERSFVLAEDVGQPEPSADACPGGPIDEQPVIVPVVPAVFTTPTCEAVGTLVGSNTAQYSWTRTGPDTAAVLTATAIGDVTLTGTTVFGPYDLTILTGEVCLGEQPIAVTPAVFTAPTCEAVGTLVGVDTDSYTWVRTGPDTAAVLTATAVGEVTLSGTAVFGPYDLTILTGEVCLSETPVIPTEVVPTGVVPTLETRAALAETGFPLLGVLGLAGSFSLIGGGLLNAGRLFRRH